MGNVPNLRFPEFTGEWEKKKMKDVCTFYSGGTPSSSNKDYYNGDIPFIRSGELHSDKTELFISSKGLKNSSAKMVSKGDLLLALYGATSGDIAISQIEGAINQAILCIKTDQSKGFIEAIWCKHVKRILQTYLQGGQGNLSADIVKNIAFYFAPLKEQEKLTQLMKLLDDRIAAQNKIIEDLKKLKSAIIDRLYKGIDGQSCLYSDLLTVVNEKNKKMEYSNVLSASQEFGMIERNDLNIDIKYEKNAIAGYKIVRDGDYVVHLRSFQGGMAFSQTVGVCSPAYIILRPNDRLSYGYLAPYFTSTSFINSLRLVTYGIRDGRSINVDEWLNMKVRIPSLEVQRHILSIIKSIECKLLNEIRIAEKLLKQRSHLLSQMFI